MRMPVYFAAEYIGCSESRVRWLIQTGELRPCSQRHPGAAILVTESEVRRWMRKNGYELSEDREQEPVQEQEPAPPAAGWIDKLVPPPDQFFDRMDDEIFGKALARAYLRCGKIPKNCPRNCPGWLSDKDCLEDDVECLYERARREKDND
jgi:hypothetical protein